MVAARHHHGAWHADPGTLLPLRDGGGIDLTLAPLVRRHDEQRGVGGAQTGAELTDEVPVAGGVDEVDLRVLVEQGSDGQRDRPLLPDRSGIVVADGGALDHRACPGNRCCMREQRLHQRRLPRARRPHEDHVAHSGRVAGGGNL